MNDEIKILIVEHDLQDIEFLERALTKGGINYVPKIVHNAEDYSEALTFFIPDIILSDYSFPSFDGLSAFRIRESMAPDTPFIFVSGAIGEETSVELIKKGVTDFVMKDKLFNLCTKVNRALNESYQKRLKNKAEQEVIQSERRLSRGQEVAHIGSWEFDYAGNDILWSDETFRIFGLAPGHRRQSFETVLAFIHPEDLNLVLRKLKRARRSCSDFFVNFRIVQNSGSIRHIFLESKLEFDPEGRPVIFNGIAHDITEIVSLEKKLIEERLTRQDRITEAVLTAQENERAYIGRELHENINQILAVVNMYIGMAITYVKDRKLCLAKSHTMISGVIEEIRKISKSLVIPNVHFVGLFGSIRNLLGDLELIHSIKFEFHPDGIPEELLNEKLQLTIFRIVQEQINNILKHARATRAIIRLSKHKNRVILVVSDNGDGCDMLKENDGVGIINIKTRIDAYRGKVTIISKPGKGYELKVVLPLNPEEAPKSLRRVSHAVEL